MKETRTGKSGPVAYVPAASVTKSGPGVARAAGVEIAVSLGDAVGWQSVAPGDRSTYKDVCLWLGNGRDAVEAALTAAGVGTKRYFVPLHTMPAYAPYQDAPLPVTDEVHRSTLCVPAFADLTFEEVDGICELVLGALAFDGMPRERLLPAS